LVREIDRDRIPRLPGNGKGKEVSRACSGQGQGQQRGRCVREAHLQEVPPRGTLAGETDRESLGHLAGGNTTQRDPVRVLCPSGKSRGGGSRRGGVLPILRGQTNRGT